MQFRSTFVNWVKACITTTRFSVNCNGTFQGYFTRGKGLRQRDALSPYLFTTGMNILSGLLAQKTSDFKHYWKCKELQLSHLFITDDVLLFSHGDKVIYIAHHELS